MTCGLPSREPVLLKKTWLVPFCIIELALHVLKAPLVLLPLLIGLEIVHAAT